MGKRILTCLLIFQQKCPYSVFSANMVATGRNNIKTLLQTNFSIKGLTNTERNDSKETPVPLEDEMQAGLSPPSSLSLFFFLTLLSELCTFR